MDGIVQYLGSGWKGKYKKKLMREIKKLFTDNT